MLGLARGTNRERLAGFRYGGKRKRASRRPSTHACVLNWTVCCRTPSAKHPLHRQTSPAKLRCCGNHTPGDLPMKRFFDSEEHFYFCPLVGTESSWRPYITATASTTPPNGLKEQFQSKLHESRI